MYDDANPLAMGSGLMLGLGIGAFVALGAPAWQDATAKMCQLASAEAGLSPQVACGPGIGANVRTVANDREDPRR